MDGTLIVEAANTSVSPPSGRRISGVALVFGAVGTSSAGPTRFEAGAIKVPDDASRVKLLLDHDASDPVGYLDAWSVDGDDLVVVFKVAEGARADLALQHATDKRRDGLSVGTSIDDWEMDGNTLVVKAATLHEVSLVSIPAFTDARVLSVQAQKGDHTVTREQIEAEQKQPEQKQPAPPAQPEQTRPAPPAQPEQTRPAPPAPPVVTSRRAEFGVADLVRLTQSHLRTGAPAATLTAALADVTPVSMGTATIGEGPNRPQYVGELWEAADVARPFLDAVGVGTLTSLKMFGFKWNVRPEVGRYAGNKAEIPTNTPTRARAEWDAQRFAGGWDVDRVFIDLPGGTDFIRDVFVEAVKSYKEQSEAYAVERLLAEATVISTESTVTLPTLLATIGQDVSMVRGGRVDVVQMGSGRWSQMLGMTEAEVPWWMRGQGSVSLTDVGGTIGGIRFSVNHDLAPFDTVVLDKRAVKAQEVDPPIKVQALDVPRGGVDLGVFGYLAVGVTDSRLVRVYRDTTP